jgi:group I intron endonuclease
MEHTKIYLVTNCYNNPNKVYIGETKNNRKKDHKRKFGSQIEYTEIDEINSLNRKDWKPLETYWINQFRAWGFEVLNKNEGGGGPTTHSKKTKEKMSKTRKGKPSPLKNTKRPEISKKLKGRKSYMNSETALKISQSLKGKPLSEEHKQKIKQTRGFLKNRKNTWQITPVVQYDLQGNFIKEWESQTEATKFLGKTGDGVGACCRGKQKNAYGYIWKFKK